MNDPFVGLISVLIVFTIVFSVLLWYDWHMRHPRY
jgi:hypothetical protein